MLALGVGLDIGMSLYTLIVQNALPTKIGQSTAALTFFRQIGGTIALAAMGSLMTAAYLPAFHTALPIPIMHAVPAQFLTAFNNPQILLSSNTLVQIQSHAAAMGPQSVAMLHQIIEAVKIGLALGKSGILLWMPDFSFEPVLLYPART